MTCTKNEYLSRQVEFWGRRDEQRVCITQYIAKTSFADSSLVFLGSQLSGPFFLTPKKLYTKKLEYDDTVTSKFKHYITIILVNHQPQGLTG